MHYDIWRMSAMNELREHNARKQAIENISARIAELEGEMKAIRSGRADGSPVKGGGCGREEMLLNNIVARQQLGRSLKRTSEAVKRVETSLAALEPEDRKILEAFFISPVRGAAAVLAGQLGIEEKTVYNRRSNVLFLFCKAMYGDV